MRIRRIDLYLNRHPFRFAFVSLHVHRRQANGLLLRMETDAGRVGWGESTPRRYVTGETCEGVCEVIESRFAEPLFAANLNSTEQLVDLLSTLSRLTSPKPARTPATLEETFSEETSSIETPPNAGITSALGAIDLALWDIWGQVCDQPASAFFISEPLPPPPPSLSVPILPLERMRSLHPLAVALGISHFKLVLCAELKENVARLALLRELVGERATITADANGKLSPEQVLAMLPSLKAFGLSAIEQPAPLSDLESLRRLRASIGLPLTIDESVCTLADARQLIDLGVCDAFNLKLSKCGGLLATQRIHALASRHGIGCQLGSHVGETPILEAGGLVAAQMLPGLSFMEIGSSFLDPCSAIHSPKSSPPLAAGLGLCIESAAVAAHFGPPVLTLRP
jgi:L-Ala-D/L-Glu epimerase